MYCSLAAFEVDRKEDQVRLTAQEEVRSKTEKEKESYSAGTAIAR